MADILDVAWAAGFIESEGTIGIYTCNRHDRSRPLPKAVIEASNTKTELLEVLNRLFGGGVHLRRKPGKDKRGVSYKKTVFGWYISHRKALWAALALQPFLHGEAREKAQEIIRFYRGRK